jgi:hypothetical protein
MMSQDNIETARRIAQSNNIKSAHERDKEKKYKNNKIRHKVMKTSFKLIAVSVGLLAIAPASQAASYDPATDFSTTTNPNGVWTYGSSTTLGGTYGTFVKNGTFDGLNYWQEGTGTPGNSDALPWIAVNPSSSTVDYSTLHVNPGELTLHPGVTGHYAVLRFTAPTAGQYDVNSDFFGQDSVGPTTTDVHVLVNGTTTFNGLINDYRTTFASFHQIVSLTQGETVDFAVGLGSNGTYFYDSTGLKATITAVPEPSTIMAGALLLLPFGVSTMRSLRRKS